MALLCSYVSPTNYNKVLRGFAKENSHSPYVVKNSTLLSLDSRVGHTTLAIPNNSRLFNV